MCLLYVVVVVVVVKQTAQTRRAIGGMERTTDTDQEEDGVVEADWRSEENERPSARRGRMNGADNK